MADVLFRCALVWIVVCAVGDTCGSRSALAQSEPAQLLLEPLSVDPIDMKDARPLGVRLRVYDLPDGRRAERTTLEGWIPVGSSHAFFWQFAYAGVETDDVIRYGGGAPRWQWTTRLRNSDPGRIAVDVAGVPPIGVGNLHPLATKALSLQARVRVAPLGGDAWRVWVGYWGQRVSPPTDRDRPLSYFPSGSGVDVACVGASERLRWEVCLHQQLGGLLDATWLEANVDLFAVEDLALRLGAAASPGPKDRRLFDRSWTVGVTWRPRPVDTP